MDFVSLSRSDFYFLSPFCIFRFHSYFYFKFVTNTKTIDCFLLRSFFRYLLFCFFLKNITVLSVTLTLSILMDMYLMCRRRIPSFIFLHYSLSL